MNVADSKADQLEWIRMDVGSASAKTASCSTDWNSHMTRRTLLAAVLLALCGANLHAQSPLTAWLDSEDSWLSSDEKLLAPLQNQTLYDGWTYSVGGALRYRYIDERNRLRPPLAAGRSAYDQYRFTPYLQLNFEDHLELYLQAIDAPTFNNDLPQVAIDENRADILQAYVDLELMELEGGKVRARAGRQFLQYGSQHLISPLGWGNTFRNFEGVKLYYSDADWSVDAFAVQPVNGAAGNIFRPTSLDSPDVSRWFGGIYATYKKAPNGTLDLYWLWLKENDDAVGIIDGNRHTLGARYAGKYGVKDAGETLFTWNWDFEGAYQTGREDFLTGPNQLIDAGFASASLGIVFDSVPWTPALNGIYYWGSGDGNPGDGRSNTVNTLFPLGHAYWGQIDNFNGQNLIDYGLHATVKPTDKLTLLSGWHWFNKQSRQDAIYNVAGVPFGGVTATPSSYLGNELDLVATYQFNKNLQWQLGYFWFWYGDAVSLNPVPAVANRADAHQFYTYIDWTF